MEGSPDPFFLRPNDKKKKVWPRETIKTQRLKIQLTEGLKLKIERYAIHKCIERRLPYYQAAALLKSAEIRNEKILNTTSAIFAKNK